MPGSWAAESVVHEPAKYKEQWHRCVQHFEAGLPHLLIVNLINESLRHKYQIVVDHGKKLVERVALQAVTKYIQQQCAYNAYKTHEVRVFVAVLATLDNMMRHKKE